ncbi:MAG: discoidin domain-containing protein [Victivallales bacterium]|nr:discoidin domain-containing protein [Victivallales bacterium]
MNITRLSFAVILFSTIILQSAGLECTFSTRPMKIDGELQEEVWLKAPVIRDFIRPDGLPLERKTEVQIVFMPTGVVFGFKVFIPKAELKILTTERDKYSSSDSVEVMLDTAGSGDNFKHIIINAGNGIYDRACEQGGFVGDEKWNGEIISAVQVYDDHWNCELLLPNYTLGIQANDSHDWKINICRESFGSPTAPREVSSVCNGVFNTAAEFRTLVVPKEVDLERHKLDATELSIANRLVDGKLSLSAKTTVSEMAGLSRSLRAELAILIPGNLPVRSEERFELTPKGTSPVLFDSVILEKPGKYDAVFTIRDDSSNRILLRKSLSVIAEYTPIKIRMISPHYRNAIFATQKLEKVVFETTVDLPKDAKDRTVTGGILKDGVNKAVSAKQLPESGKLTFEFPVEGLPDGKMEVFVSAGPNKATLPLRKLPYKKGEVWRGTDGNWYKDGKKIFVLAGWNIKYNPHYLIVTATKAPEDKSLLFYNSNTFLGIGKIKADIVQGKLSPAVKEFYQKKIDMCKDEPQLFAHFLCDEPDIAGYTKAGFRKIYEYIVDLDPYHPFMISPGSSGLIDFEDMAEISGFHCYPKVEPKREMANFSKIVVLMDKAMKHFGNSPDAPTITYVHQGFDYSDSGNTDTRVPSYEEFRSQNLLSIILGGKGLLHYNRGDDNFPELSIGMEPLTIEEKVIGNEAIIEPDAEVPAKADQAELRLLAKRNEATGDYWVLACNASDNAADLSLSFPPFASRRIQVLSEKRGIDAPNGTIKDHFKPFEVHVYTTSQKDFRLESIEEIKARIEAAYIERRKQNVGNVLYQEHENDTVKVNASSNKFMIFRAENSLWHLTDGLIGDFDKPAVSPTREGITVWQDNTPNEVPDYAVITLNQPQTIGRVEVYPAQNSLKDYEIQLKIDGEFKTVGKINDAEGPMQTFSFSPVKTDALKLLVTANRGAYTKVYEIKAFEK